MECLGGWGRYFYEDGGYYEGEWFRNMKSGKGMFFYQNGDHYVGEWKENMKWGKGTIHYFRGGKMKCLFYKNMKHGKCILIDRKGEKTEEKFKMGEKITQSPANHFDKAESEVTKSPKEEGEAKESPLGEMKELSGSNESQVGSKTSSQNNELQPISEKIESQESSPSNTNNEEKNLEKEPEEGSGKKEEPLRINKPMVRPNNNKDRGDRADSYISQESMTGFTMPLGSHTVSMVNHLNNMESIQELLMEKESNPEVMLGLIRVGWACPLHFSLNSSSVGGIRRDGVAFEEQPERVH